MSALAPQPDFLPISLYEAAAPDAQVYPPYFFLLTPRNTLPDILNTPYHLFIEIGKYTALNISLAQMLTRSPDFAVCMTTASAYRADVACQVTMALSQRFGLPNHQSAKIETCVHEAVVNAVVHGNLGINSDFNSQENMDLHYLLIEKQMKHDPYRYRRVTVCAWREFSSLKISVTDQGQGFQFSDTRQEYSLPHGRGLQLIRGFADSAWIGEDRRTLFMTFAG